MAKKAASYLKSAYYTQQIMAGQNRQNAPSKKKTIAENTVALTIVAQNMDIKYFS